MFIPDDCPNLVDIKKSLPNHKRELYKELETPRIEHGYKWFLQALLSKAEDQLKNEREQVIDNVENAREDDNDPRFESFRRNLKEHGRSYALEDERNGAPIVEDCEEEEEEEEEEESSFSEVGHHRKMKKSGVQKLNQHTSQMRPRSGVNGSVQNRAVRKIGNGRGKEPLNTDVVRQNQKQALSSKKFNAESSRVSKAILVDFEDSFEPDHDRTVRLGKRVADQVQSGSRRVVDRRDVDKGKSVIQVEDPVHENTNQRPNLKNRVERIDKTPNTMDKARVTRKLSEVVKGKNMVRGDQMDQGRSSQKPGPGSNPLPKKLSEHVEKGKAQSEKGLKRPAARTYTVIEDHFERGDSAQRLQEGEERSSKKLKKVVREERESSVQIIASSPPRSPRRQLGNNSQVQSSAKVITRQLRSVEVTESSRPKKNPCKNNQRKESDDEAASDMQILDSTAVFEGNLGPFVPSKLYKGDASADNGRANVLSEFRVNVLNALKSPFDKEEYHKLQEAVQNGSYLKTYPDLRAILVKNRYIKEKRLTILRGFFFWLQNLTQEGSFKPWKDRECLAVEQESG